MVAHSSEFENIAVREEEQNELETLVRTSCPLEVKGGPSNKHGKISILIQVTIWFCFVYFCFVCFICRMLTMFASYKVKEKDIFND